jgi:hypothetical protein
MSSWRNDIQSLVKKCRNLALSLFFPQVSNRCRVSDQEGGGGGTEFTLTAAYMSRVYEVFLNLRPCLS